MQLILTRYGQLYLTTTENVPCPRVRETDMKEVVTKQGQVHLLAESISGMESAISDSILFLPYIAEILHLHQSKGNTFTVCHYKNIHGGCFTLTYCRADNRLRICPVISGNDN